MSMPDLNKIQEAVKLLEDGLSNLLVMASNIKSFVGAFGVPQAEGANPEAQPPVDAQPEEQAAPEPAPDTAQEDLTVSEETAPTDETTPVLPVDNHQ